MANSSAETVSMIRIIWIRRRRTSLPMAWGSAHPNLRNLHLSGWMGFVAVHPTGRENEHGPPQRLDDDGCILKDLFDFLHFYSSLGNIEGGFGFRQCLVEFRIGEVAFIPCRAGAVGLCERHGSQWAMCPRGRSEGYLIPHFPKT